MENIDTKLWRLVAAFMVCTWLIGCRVAAAQAAPAAAVQGGAEPGKSLPADISDLLRPLLADATIPAMGALVIRGDAIIAQGVVGVREIGKESKATLGDKWHLGSCTKSMTATLLAILVSESKITWATTIGEVFGDIPRFDAEWKDVTVEQLLAHRAGVPSDLKVDGLWTKLWNHKGTPTEQRRTLVDALLRKKPIHKPGGQYLYSNAGVSIAGAVAEKRTGQSWEELIEQRLFAPLGITSGGTGAPGTPGKLDQPRGHTAAGEAAQPGPNHAGDNPAAIAPGGTIHMTLPDWGKYIAMHLAGERGEDRVLAAKAIVALHLPYPAEDKDRYGWGWSFTDRDWADGAVFTHNGSNNLWFAVTWVAPKKNMAILVVCNKGGGAAAKACDRAASELVGRFVKD